MVASRTGKGTVSEVETAQITDIERAVALLALDRQVLEPALAASLIRRARSGSHRPLVELLLERVPEVTVLRAVADELGIRFFDPYATSTEFAFEETVFAMADPVMLRRFNALPLRDTRGRVVIAVANPQDLEMLDYLRARYGNDFSLVLAPRAQVQNKLAYYGSTDMQLPTGSFAAAPSVPIAQSAPSIRDAVSARSPVQEWLDLVLERAVAEGASDVHFMYQSDRTLLLRFRVDGVLRTQRVPSQIRPVEVIGSIVSRCPTMDAANMVEPQDGTFSFEAAGRTIDARVALLPQTYGPTVVLRLLDSMAIRTRLDDMGFSTSHLRVLREVMQRAQGTVLAVGPTGSGKSTTLYALLREVNAAEKNVLTVENPVEYRLPMIGQTEIRSTLGARSLTFPRALRTILRLDPDVILVGEIRDQETAEVAMQAAITGHLVLSTVHANSALAAFPRLMNMGLPAYLVAEALSVVISQRLLRRVHECARMDAPTPEEIAALTNLGLEPPPQVAHAVGCGACNGSGFRGRIAAVEVLVPTVELRSLVLEQASATRMIECARSSGFVPIIEDGLRHLGAGRTTVAEMTRVLSMEERAADNDGSAVGGV
jgi:type II secretory ATPase GspE/PulE/Tfp pilus assembly ATPase PilB-like protein